MCPWRRRGGATVLPPAPAIARRVAYSARACQRPASAASGWGPRHRFFFMPASKMAACKRGTCKMAAKMAAKIAACGSLATAGTATAVAVAGRRAGGCHGKPLPPPGLEKVEGECDLPPTRPRLAGPAPGQASRSSHRPPPRTCAPFGKGRGARFDTRVLGLDALRPAPGRVAAFCRLRRSAPERVLQSPNPAALPASMGRNSEGRRRVIERKGRRGPRTRWRSQAVAGCRLQCAPCAGASLPVSRRTTGAVHRAARAPARPWQPHGMAGARPWTCFCSRASSWPRALPI